MSATKPGPSADAALEQPCKKCGEEAGECSPDCPDAYWDSSSSDRSE